MINETTIYLLVFLASCFIFFFSGELVVKSLIKIAKYLGWKEFVVSFLVMAFVGSLPNLFVGISSALHGIPELSFGDVIGGNVVDLTLSIALAAIFAKNGIPAKSKTVHNTLFFTIIAAILPILLIGDGVLSRIDGILLILFFFLYVAWLFSKKERFTKICEDENTITQSFKASFNGVFKVILSIVLFIIAAEGIVRSASYFAITFNLPIALIGIFIVGLGNCVPEIFFAISSARKGVDWMILGDLMGTIVAPATLVLGIVSLINPIVITDFSPFFLARIFTFLAIFLFFIFIKNDSKISKKEAAILLMVYIAFILSEIFIRR
ncbi:MAG: sodium:calcium antiporter [Candidatus Pacebacteria bacterium]|nr:sodium:calcium antiporter [Candidatus Paceibacterota bacterium]